MAGLKCCTFVHANPFNKQLSIFCAETFVHQCSSLSKMKCLKVWSEEAHENNWLFDESFHFNNKISPFCCCRWLEFKEDIFCFQSFISGNGSLVCNLTFHPKQPYGNMWKRHEKWICVHGHKLCFFFHYSQHNFEIGGTFYVYAIHVSESLLSWWCNKENFLKNATFGIFTQFMNFFLTYVRWFTAYNLQQITN